MIRARLWESTLLEDFPSVDMVKIVSRGQILLDPNLNIQQTSTLDDQAEVCSLNLFYFHDREMVCVIFIDLKPGLIILHNDFIFCHDIYAKQKNVICYACPILCVYQQNKSLEEARGEELFIFCM